MQGATGEGLLLDQLGIFAKYWQPGQVKTRLAAGIGEVPASEIYREFVVTLLKRLAEPDGPHPGPLPEGEGVSRLRRVLCFSPTSRQAAFESIADGWNLQPQGEGDLGQRMQRYFDSAFEAGCRRVVLLGSDSPNIPIELIQQAFAELTAAEIVLGPTPDGGYYLIGARERTPDVFAGIPWSSMNVWDETIAKVQALGLRCATLPEWYDVDEMADLRRLQSDLATADASELTRLREAIGSHGTRGT